MKPLILTSGDPAGIGPEVALKAANLWQRQAHARPILVAGDPQWLDATGKELGIPTENINFLPINWDKESISKKSVGKASGQAAFEAVRAAVSLCVRNEAAGLVTAPIHKESLALAGHPWPGHTEMLADLASPSAPPSVRMMLVNPDLRVVLDSVHESVRDMLDGLNTGHLVQTILLAHKACEQFGLTRPRIGIAGLNPHAGEGGLFGREELDIISPAVSQARSLGLDASGPWPGDTIFMRARGFKEFDAVVAIYHDQGLIPIKYMGLDQGVNLTLGLPFIRTSVDHGTAFDIAYQGVADPGSMLSAIGLADRLASQSDSPSARTNH